MGRGRHAVVLGRAGCRVFGVDISLDAVRTAVEAAHDEGLALRAWCGDLKEGVLPAGRFSLIVVTRYLQRDLFPALVGALAPGGVLLYETFTDHQRALGRGPTSADHLLKPGELAARCGDLEPIAYEEVEEPDALARLAARRRHSPS